MAEYPVYFEDFRICIHCGSNSVRAINRFNKPTNDFKDFIHPISKFRCMDCNREYYIKWVKDKEGKIIPVCCGESDINKVANDIINISKDKRRIL